jgi:hypothetical protein
LNWGLATDRVGTEEPEVVSQRGGCEWFLRSSPTLGEKTPKSKSKPREWGEWV